MPRHRSFEWVTYKYRYFNQESVKEFGSWLAQKDWVDVATAEGSNRKAECYQKEVTAALERVFPLITVRKKSTNCPWINARIRRLISRRKGIYIREARSEKWRRLKKISDDFIKKEGQFTWTTKKNACWLTMHVGTSSGMSRPSSRRSAPRPSTQWTSSRASRRTRSPTN